LDFKADSLPSEMAFFENLTLPSSTEDFSLTLTGFTLPNILLNNENTPPYSQFFKRLQEEKRVKALNLRINSKLVAQFACLLIKCFDNLEVLEYTNLPSR